MCLERYVTEFNVADHEYYQNDIDNAHALEWLQNEIPLLECPDEDIERTYYFRWWVYRKHIKKTPEGYMVTEFLPEVPWSGKYNLINAAVGHHIMEGRWLKHADKYLKDYIYFFLNNQEEGMRYSSWLLWAAKEFQMITGSLQISDFLKKAIPYYSAWEKARKTECGLFWSVDDRDAMEFSISGTRNGKMLKGIRPTLNSYMYGDAMAIYLLSEQCGQALDEFRSKAEDICQKMWKLLWKDDFFRAWHPENGIFSDTNNRNLEKAPRELIGYIPWYFGMPKQGHERVFLYLEDPKIFSTKFGITTADQSHPEFLFHSEHECLWNGYIWPFATAQTLTALIQAAEADRKIYGGIFCRLLRQYAKQHSLTLQNGKKIMWIDEVRSPYEDVWFSREKLKECGWPKEKGGYERGKDYNHSTFCDLVITGLAGVRVKNNTVFFRPMLPETWQYFRLDNLNVLGDSYQITYDKNGEKYGKRGWTVLRNGVEVFDRVNAVECE